MGQPASERRHVAILAFDDCQLLDVAGPLQAFATASELAGPHAFPGYTVSVYSRGGGPVRTSSGLVLLTRPLRALRVDGRTTVMLPGGRGVRDAASDRKLIARIQQANRRAERICSVCTGAFLLAATGLVDGRRVTTHWRSCEQLQELHPRLRVERDPIFVRDGRYWTSAGVTAGIDLALALIEADAGKALALETARHLVVFFKRPGGQAQFSDLLAAQSRESARFAQLHAWIAAHLRGDLTVASLAERACMSPRNFQRVYKATMGATPARMIERIRVEAARRLIEDGAARVGAVAKAVGFGDDETMRRAFLRQIGVSPVHYRRGFLSPQSGVRQPSP